MYRGKGQRGERTESLGRIAEVMSVVEQECGGVGKMTEITHEIVIDIYRITCDHLDILSINSEEYCDGCECQIEGEHIKEVNITLDKFGVMVKVSGKQGLEDTERRTNGI